MKSSVVVLLMAISFTVRAQAPSTSSSNKLSSALALVREDEIRRDLFALASDDMRGRRAGTIDELRAAVWVAQQAQKAGLKPAGEDGTYFQFFPLRRIRVADNSQIQINGKTFLLWKDVWVTSPVESRMSDSVLWLQSLADTSKLDVSGKVIAMRIQPPNPLPTRNMSLRGYRYALSAVRQQSTLLKAKGAVALILVADTITENALGFVGHNSQEGLYQLDGMTTTQSSSNIPVILVRQSEATNLQQPATHITIDLHAESFIYPSVNVIAVAPGNDPQLRNEYVLFSGHHDHDGIGEPVDDDSIWNGADDNASVSVAMLAIGRAWIKHPTKRSALFVWHGAEERGLYGSRWYVEHPTVKKEPIVAVLNGDMIGRNAPGSAALLGAVPPHRNSTDLVNMAMQANRQYTNFIIDTSWDDPKHPEYWYFRSDHLPYARAGVPALFFSTLLHPDYHTPKDEADRIDIRKLIRMTKWMYATGWQGDYHSVANIRSQF